MAGRLKFHKEGEWEQCAIALNGISGAPDTVRSGLLDIAWGIIVPALDDTKANGDFAENAESTVRKKGFNHPWVDGGQPRTTGSATAFSAGAGGVQVMLSGDQQVVDWVDRGSTGPARPLFQQTWEKCEPDVREAVDSLLASAMAGATSIRRRTLTGQYAKTSNYGGSFRKAIK